MERSATRAALFLFLATSLALGPAAQALAQEDDSLYFGDEESAQPGQPPPETSPQQMFSSFYASLSPYGQWIQDPRYSWVWLPSEPDYRPYSNGQWVYTTDGWTFDSAEPFGWAVDHYGRWLWTSQRWAWVPGYVWSPAWVEFRYAPGYVGWCPLGPGDFVYGFQLGLGVTPWLFVSVNLFGSPLYPSAYLPPYRAHDVYEHGHHVPPRAYGGSRVWYEVPGATHGRPVSPRQAYRPPHDGIRPPASNGAVPPPVQGGSGWMTAPPRHERSGVGGSGGAAVPPPAHGWTGSPRVPEPSARAGSGAPVVVAPPPSAARPVTPSPRPAPAAPAPRAPAAPAPAPAAPPSSGSHGSGGHGWVPGGAVPGGRR